MRVRLVFPPGAVDEIRAMGLRHSGAEKLRLVMDHPGSHHGLGVLLRGKSGDLLDGATLAVLRARWGAWIEVDDARVQAHVRRALATAPLGLDDAVIIADVGVETGDHD